MINRNKKNSADDTVGSVRSLPMVNAPMDASAYKGDNYKDVEQSFIAAGFENVQVSGMDDLVTGWITKEGSVEKIYINGNSEFSKGEKFPQDATVIISYHSFD